MPILVLLVALTAAGVVLNTIVATPTVGSEPVDYPTFGQPGADILTGHWAGIFSDPIIQAGPFELIFWGIPFLLGVHGLIGWIAFGIVASSLFAVAAAVVAERLLRPLTPAWSTPLAVGVAAVAAVSGLLSASLAAGHPAEVAIPVLWLIAGALARRGQPLAAAAALAATTGWELWGLLGVPVLLLAPRVDLRTVWRSAVGGVLVIAVLFLPFALLGPFHMFGYGWVISSNSMAHLLFPTATSFPWPLRLIQAVLSVGAGAAVAWLIRRRPDALWLVPLVVCVVRLFTDPVLAGYYAVPPFLLLLVGVAFSIAQRALVPVLLGLVMVNVLIDVPLSLIPGGILVVLSAILAVVIIRRGRAGAVTGVDADALTS